jgi:hypothetical protein
MVTAALVATSLTVVATATSQAEPAKPTSNATHYTAKLVGKDVVLTLDKGSFDVVKNVKTRAGVAVTGDAAKQADVKDAELAEVRDSSGKLNEKIPLWYRFNGTQYPVASKLSADKRRLTLTPVTDPAKVHVLNTDQTKAQLANAERPGKTSVISLPDAKQVAAQQSKQAALPQAKEIASPEENTLAQNNFNTQLGIATTAGSLVGTAIGVALGIPIGIIAAGAACAVGALALLIGCFVAAAPAFLAVTSVMGVVGTVLAGGGTLVAAGWDLIQTMQARPHTTHYQAEIDQRNAENRGHR